MDAQRKKGILDVCVLAVLKKGPSYGYMIIRDISRCIEISESTLYPILKRLEQNGSLKTYRQEYNGRTRKYYELTETGQTRIDVFLEEWEELQTMYHFVEEENARVPRPQEEAAEESRMASEAVRESRMALEAAEESRMTAEEAAEEGQMASKETAEESRLTTEEAAEESQMASKETATTEEAAEESQMTAKETAEESRMASEETAEEGRMTAQEMTEAPGTGNEGSSDITDTRED